VEAAQFGYKPKNSARFARALFYTHSQNGGAMPMIAIIAMLTSYCDCAPEILAAPPIGVVWQRRPTSCQNDNAGLSRFMKVY